MDLLASYEEMPYESNPLHFTHPDALATAAFLAGMQPAPVENCRVLEIGCATGGNLVPMAASLPQSKFVGIDLSPRQIEIGRAQFAPLDLGNIDLRAMDLLQIDRAFGEFDYIVCHGVYSWCPPPVQDKILQICAENLAKNGVAYISYNTYPGWHRWMALREMMSYQTRDLPSPRARVEAARRFLDGLAVNFPPEAAHVPPLREAIEQLRALSDSHLFHEYLEPFNQPRYFHQVIAHAAAHGLGWLGESTQQSYTDDLTQAAQRDLARTARNEIDLEQQLDFLRNTMFRASLFVHAGAAFDRAAAAEPSIAKLRALRINSSCKPESPAPDMISSAPESFRGQRVKISTGNPLVKTILCGLHEIDPRAVTLAELTQAVRARLGDRALAEEDVADAVAACHSLNLIALHLWAPRCTSEAGPMPKTSVVARLLAPGRAPLPSLRHRGIDDLAPFDRSVLALLDGTRDRAALMAQLSCTRDMLEPSLARLARRGFLTE